MSQKEHPALKDFNTPWETFKIVASKAVKWAAVGAIAFAALPIIASALVAILPGVSLLGAASTIGVGGALMGGAAMAGGLGAISALGGISNSLDERRQDFIADYEQASVARERATLVQQRGKQVSGGANVSPGAGYGRTQQSQGLGA